jgi:tetratricopeptide (TPR) repeat protein
LTRAHLILCAFLGSCAPAASQPAAPTPVIYKEPVRGRKALAKDYFEAARAHYNLGRFEEALAEFTQAYEALPNPELLFNIGQCHRKLDQCERAIFFFNGYLREMPKAKDRADVAALIKECERRPKSKSK